MKKNINYLLFLLLFVIFNKLYATKIEILAKVNNQIITNMDLEYRLNLAIEISNIPNEIKFRKQIRINFVIYIVLIVKKKSSILTKSY